MNKIDLSAALVVFEEYYKSKSISTTSEGLGISRSTVRSHFDRLAQLLNNGQALIHKGKLTEDGERLYARIKNDLAVNSETLDAIQNSPLTTGLLAWASQRHNVELLENRDTCTPILFHAWRAWRTGGANLDSIGMRALVPWSMIFRQWTNGWMLVEIGEKSSFASWFGPERARYFKSEVRQSFLTGDVSFRETARAYDEVGRWGTPILHHVHACIPRFEGQENEWISYQRLVLPIGWGDDVGLAVFVARTNDVQIEALAEGDRHPMPPDMLMEEELTEMGTL